MAFREVRVYEVREVLRLWLDGEGLRSIERLSQVDRKTVRRYVAAAEELGLIRDGGGDQLGDAFVGAVVEVVRPHRSDGHGGAWRLLGDRHEPLHASGCGFKPRPGHNKRAGQGGMPAQPHTSRHRAGRSK